MDDVMFSHDYLQVSHIGEFSGHSGAIMCLLAVPDGGILFSGSQDGSIMAWKPSSPYPLKTMEGHSGAVESLVMHAGYLYSASDDGTVRKWNEFGICVAVLEGHTETVKVLAADPLYLYSGSYDGTIKAWRPASEAALASGSAGAAMVCRATLKSFEGPVEAMAVDAARMLLYTAGRDSAIRVWNTATMSTMLVLRGHLAVVTTLLFHDGNLYSGSADKSIMVWKDGHCITMLSGHTEAVRVLTLHDGCLYSGANDSTIRMWDTSAAQRAPVTNLASTSAAAMMGRGAASPPVAMALPAQQGPGWPTGPGPAMPALPFLPLPANPNLWKGAGPGGVRPPPLGFPAATLMAPPSAAQAAYALLNDAGANLNQLAALSFNLHPQALTPVGQAIVRPPVVGGYSPPLIPLVPATMPQDAWLTIRGPRPQGPPLLSAGAAGVGRAGTRQSAQAATMGGKGRGSRPGSGQPVIQVPGAVIKLADGVGKGGTGGVSSVSSMVKSSVSSAAGAAEASKVDAAACWGDNPKNVLIGSNLYGGTNAGAQTGGGPLPLSTYTLPNNSGFCTTMPLPDGLGSATGAGRKKAEAEKNCVLDALEQLRIAGVIMPPSVTGGKGAAVVTEDRIPPRLEIPERHRAALEMALQGFWNSPSPQVPRSKRLGGESLGLIDSFVGLDLSAQEGGTTGEGPPAGGSSSAGWPTSQPRLAALNADLQARAEARRRDPGMAAWLEARDRLPVSRFREDILRTVAKHPMTLLIGETGCGKTTQVPQMLLEDAEAKGVGAGVRVIVTQPRKVAAITVAERVARERGESLGESVGYSVKLEMVKPRRHGGTIMFCTTGVLLRQLQSGEGLAGISHVIIDEAHERSLEIDFLLLLLKELVQGQSQGQGPRQGAGQGGRHQRNSGWAASDIWSSGADGSMMPTTPLLKVIVMSATLESCLFQQYFSSGGGPCPTISVPGFLHPVQELYLENLAAVMHTDCPPAVLQALRLPPPLPLRAESAYDSYRPSGGAVARGLEGLAAETILDPRRVNVDVVADAALFVSYMLAGSAPGAVLVFLPSWDIISAIKAAAASSLAPLTPLVLVLHSSISMEEQRRVFEPAPPGTRKLILSTNIAETSVTIDDVRFVVDSGRAKEKMYHAHTDTAHMLVGWTSRAACKQRAGRAGRVGPGVCIRLFTREVVARMDEHTTAELLRSPLEELVLQVKALGDAAAERQRTSRGSLSSSSATDICVSTSTSNLSRGSMSTGSNSVTVTGSNSGLLTGGSEGNLAVSLCAEASRKGGVQPFLSRLIQPPQAAVISKALVSLQDMNALDEEEMLTPLGRVLAQLPLHPRVGKMIVYGGLLGCLDAVLALAAAIDVKDPFVAPFGFRAKADACRHRFAATCNAHASDHLALLAAFQGFEVAERGGYANQFCEENCLSATTLRMMARVRDKFAREVTGTHLAGLMTAMGSGWGQASGQDHFSAMGLIRAVLCAALYPSVAYTDIVPGKTKGKKVAALRLLGSNVRVYAHAGSVLSERHLEAVRPNSHHVVFHEKVHTTQLFIHGCTLVPVLALVFFGGPLSLRPLNAAECRWAANAAAGNSRGHGAPGITPFDPLRDSPAAEHYPPAPNTGPPQPPYYPGTSLQAYQQQQQQLMGGAARGDRGGGFLSGPAFRFDAQGFDPVIHPGLPGHYNNSAGVVPPPSLSLHVGQHHLSQSPHGGHALPQQQPPGWCAPDSHLVLEVGASSLSFMVHRRLGQLLVETRRALDGILESWINGRDQTQAQTQLVGCVRVLLLSYDSRGASSR
eukprot:jgi/Mesvir1/29092/Mv18397-RA.1